MQRSSVDVRPRASYRAATTSPARVAQFPFASVLRAAALLVAVSAGACVLAPEGLDAERKALEGAGGAFAEPFERRSVRELPDRPDWQQVLERAFAVNGELEVSYFEWQAALARVAAAAGYPNTNLMPSFSYLLSGGQMKAWDRTTVQVGFDPMQNLAFPAKVRQAGRVALEEARAAGRRFAAAKFALQRTVLETWLDLALTGERIAIQQERLDLARLATDSAAVRAQLRGGQRDLLRAQIEYHEAHLGLTRLEAEATARTARLNGLLARDPGAELSVALPEPRPLAADDAALIAAGVANNPELQALSFAVAGGEGALELARLQYIPDFNPFVGFVGSIQQILGVGVVLPTALPRIRAGIEVAEATLQESRARLRQTQFDRRASFVAALFVLRNMELHAEVLAREVLPQAEQLLGAAREAYAAGSTTFLELLEVQRTVLDERAMLAEVRIERERRLAELEEISGLDVETLAPRAMNPSERTESRKANEHE